MTLKRFARLLLAAVSMLLLAAATWAVVGYLLSAPLGRLYGWSGHPPVPAAPTSVYVALYLVVLPAMSLGLAWLAVGGVLRLVARRGDRLEAGAGVEEPLR